MKTFIVLAFCAIAIALVAGGDKKPAQPNETREECLRREFDDLYNKDKIRFVREFRECIANKENVGEIQERLVTLNDTMEAILTKWGNCGQAPSCSEDVMVELAHDVQKMLDLTNSIDKQIRDLNDEAVNTCADVPTKRANQRIGDAVACLNNPTTKS